MPDLIFNSKLVEQCDHSLLTQLFERSFVKKQNETFYNQDGTIAPWALDVRRGLAHGTILNPIACLMKKVIASRDISQIAGSGFGSSFIVGGMVASGMRGALIRESPKTYGFKRLIEGDIDRDNPIALVEDLISTGKTAAKSLSSLLDFGIKPTYVLSIFKYSWKDHGINLDNFSIPVDSLVLVS